MHINCNSSQYDKRIWLWLYQFTFEPNNILCKKVEQYWVKSTHFPNVQTIIDCVFEWTHLHFSD